MNEEHKVGDRSELLEKPADAVIAMDDDKVGKLSNEGCRPC
jgi:hypothetical protein